MNNLGTFLDKFLEKKFEDVPFRNYRDELVAEFVDGINKSRIGTKFKPITAREVALRINKNAFLAKHENNGEVAYLLKQCKERNNYSKFFWVTK